MQQVSVRVTIPRGLHARAAASLAGRARDFHSSIFLTRGRSASLASVMDLLALGVGEGEVVTVTADGSDEQEALRAVVALLGEALGPAPSSGRGNAAVAAKS